MRRFGPHPPHSDPSEMEARRRVLSAIGSGRLSGFEVARALAAADADSAGAPGAASAASAPAAKSADTPGAASVASADTPGAARAASSESASDTPAGRDESFLYPTLHSLEADGDLQAAWTSAGPDKSRRTYARRRRFRPFPFGTR